VTLEELAALTSGRQADPAQHGSDRITATINPIVDESPEALGGFMGATSNSLT
jgi:hypothetical protein